MTVYAIVFRTEDYACVMTTEWLRQGKKVLVMSIWEHSLAATYMLYHMLQVIITTQLRDVVSPTQVQLLLKNFKHDKDFDATLDECTIKGRERPLYVIADEVGPDFESEKPVFPEFRSRLLHRFRNREQNLHLWAASCHHNVASDPKGWETTLFTRPLRSPPFVIEEIKKCWEIEHCMVHMYNERGVPYPTNDPAIEWMIHRSQDHGTQNVKDCTVCGIKVANLLRDNLRIGLNSILHNSVRSTSNSSPSSKVTSLCLNYKDVLILSKLLLREDTGILSAMSKAGVLVRVMKNFDIKTLPLPVQTLFGLQDNTLSRD